MRYSLSHPRPRWPVPHHRCHPPARHLRGHPPVHRHAHRLAVLRGVALPLVAGRLAGSHDHLVGHDRGVGRRPGWQPDEWQPDHGYASRICLDVHAVDVPVHDAHRQVVAQCDGRAPRYDLPHVGWRDPQRRDHRELRRRRAPQGSALQQPRDLEDHRVVRVRGGLHWHLRRAAEGRLRPSCRGGGFPHPPAREIRHQQEGCDEGGGAAGRGHGLMMQFDVYVCRCWSHPLGGDASPTGR
mmetsp:Transcript_31521/g.104303  ORF Transcript_31521/g.104303 Transcript_31521/m.104303 type:complete len:240 (+) Transcript_31521:1179-1898(+)